MLHERFQVPLSPPKSPRMSDAATKHHDYKYHQVPPRHYESPGVSQDINRPYSHNVTDAAARSHHWGPYNDEAQDNTHAGSHYAQQGISSSTHHLVGAHAAQAGAGGSVASSPRDRLTPRSPASLSRDHHDDDDEIEEFGGEDQEDDDDTDKPPMTAAEIRAQKRKMKRFRLTHNQTRFLMSEFTRQAHPDAAHRERLAREIPGLSARQVQVWFQNRRAKLKRLTNDDRERMLRSRTLPADFDTTQTLHSPFGAQATSAAASISTIGAYNYGENAATRPLTLDTFRRAPQYEQYGQQYASPTGVSPALSAFAFTPPPSASDHMSPGSVAGSVSPYVLHNPAPYESSRRPPTSLPALGPTSYPSQPQHLQRMPLHERLGRTTGEPTSSPLRSSFSYAHLTSASAQPRHIPERAASFSDHSFAQHRSQYQSTTSHGTGESGLHGLGFSYSQGASFQPGENQYQTPVSGAYSPTEPEPFRRSTPVSYAQYPTTNLPGNTSQYGSYGGHYSSESYHNNYAQHGQVTEPVSPPPQNHGYHASQGPAQPYLHGQHVASSQSQTLPSSY
ncbi:hypothetical protein CERZMDRAFT_87877 [Cercospora zeae-maydis SCOH1-5]|uniref:Homeobox domain-containing protein n=1 Tax=Cercospora zeae-maydis SCOH1-5 TaxID=717836 RepID=A0A6A6F326_9PEZI|nr:hypothetical protein CERZMDRAFT_87877 [Cercospora zeae-maydis SCOH1-5]